MFSDADKYDRFMGRYSTLLARQMADLAGVQAGQRVIDVGCGPGALTAELVARVAATSVAAVDPNEPFLAAARERHPGIHARRAFAESLPYEDRAFDAALSQLVVHFMRDPVKGLAEMARVTKSGGTVVACVWDHAGGSPLTPYWRAARDVDPNVTDESALPGVREGHLAELFGAAGLRDVRTSVIVASVRHDTFESWWAPFELGIGPPGVHWQGLDAPQRAAVRERTRTFLPEAPFTMDARAWAVRGTVAD